MPGQKVHAMQRIDAIVSRLAHTLAGASGSRREHMGDQAILILDGTSDERVKKEPDKENTPHPPNLKDMNVVPGNSSDPTIVATEAAHGDCVGVHIPERSMDKDLSGDMLKLVRYKVLFVKRGYEVAFPEQEELIPDNTTAAAYTAWKVAQFIQRLDDTEVPAKWGKDNDGRPRYPLEPKQIGSKGKQLWMINALPEDDKKYLRVFFEVLDRYPREKINYQSRQIKVLEQIRDRLG